MLSKSSSAPGADEADLLAVAIVDLVDHAEYKRRQSPESWSARITSRAFGKDRRVPMHESLSSLNVR